MQLKETSGAKNVDCSRARMAFSHDFSLEETFFGFSEVTMGQGTQQPRLGKGKMKTFFLCFLIHCQIFCAGSKGKILINQKDARLLHGYGDDWMLPCGT